MHSQYREGVQTSQQKLMKITRLSIISRVVIYKILVWDLGMRVSGTVIFCCAQSPGFDPQQHSLNNYAAYVGGG